MKFSCALFCMIILMEACSQNDSRKTNGTGAVFVKKDRHGRIIEKWGNEKSWDNDINFRYFFYYDSSGLLVEEKQYWFQDDNVECNIVDSLEFIHVEYLYESGVIRFEKKYFPVYDEQTGRITGHKLGYVFDHRIGKEIIVK